MKTTLQIETTFPEKISLLIQVAKEMGIEVKNSDTVYPLIIADELTTVSEPALSEAWKSKEDERWDELYK